MEIAEVVMNPIRQRIFQYFLLHETGTVKGLLFFQERVTVGKLAGIALIVAGVVVFSTADKEAG